MRTIRRINEEELDTFVTISANAYPGMDVFAQAERRRFRGRLAQAAENPHISLFALFDDKHMQGVMRLYDFTMNFLSTNTLVGGVGGVAVDLLHKKEKVAADMMRYFLQHYRHKGACLAALYPFRPDFYHRMGFGFGTKMNSYRFSPDSLPKGLSKRHVVFLTEKDRDAICACYDRFFAGKHGVMMRWQDVWDAMLNSPAIHAIGVKKGSQLSGYMVYKFDKGSHDNFLSNNILIHELVYENPDALRELLAYLQSQADQIEQIILNIQDEDWHHLLQDPRYGSNEMIQDVIAHESNVQGVGIMYRVIDLPRLFEILHEHNFGGVTCRLKIELSDSFLPQNEGGWVVNFVDGKAKLVSDEAFDLAIRLDVSEFSSLVVGAVGFAKLIEYGLASISDSNSVPLVDRLFAAPKPICLTRF